MCDQDNPNSGECRCKVERVPSYALPRLLLELAKKSSHGYELIERLTQESSAAIDPGNFYRMLRSLEEDGLVCSTWETQSQRPGSPGVRADRAGHGIPACLGGHHPPDLPVVRPFLSGL